MSVPAILAPLFVQVLLTLALMLGMMVFRGKAVLRGETRIESIALREPNWPRASPRSATASQPVRIAGAVLRPDHPDHDDAHADLIFVLLAWVFVALRVAQAYIHVTSNHVGCAAASSPVRWCC